MTVAENPDWPRLLHAYGRATDTPAHLQALLGQDPAAIDAAVQHLWSAILHQGTSFPATAPVLRQVSAWLAEGRIADPGLQASLLDFLATAMREVVGVITHVTPLETLRAMADFDLSPFLDAGEGDDALYEEEAPSNALYAQSVLGCLDSAHHLLPAVDAGLRDCAADVRAHAADCAAALCAVPGLNGHRATLVRQVRECTATANGDERSAHVLALGTMQEDVRAFLNDASPGVRLCAALAPGLRTDAAALAELLRAWQHPHAVDGWYPQRPPTWTLAPRFYLLDALLDRVPDFAVLADGAVALAAHASLHSVDHDWGRLLVAAFRAGDGRIHDAAQRRYLAALVDNGALWDSRNGNAALCFKKAGLPHDRALCQALVVEGGQRGR